ncbi:LOW QUALITY PROTEIN: T0195358 isoform 1 [Pan troglodytes]|uniref:RING-type E3 ubiquitin transferase n=1 Tax=Pan troglodytes TaxID=9598 RepID=A0A2J8ILR0_PANTR|nr:LOW QUALITY PROTEIN: T0195358 isoform 1 [Pan troglodytes]
MAELDLMAPGPLPRATAQPPAPLSPDSGSPSPDSGSASPVEEEDVGSSEKLGRETEEQDSDSAEQGDPAGEGKEVLCDFCLDDTRRVKAVKSCLTCMVNYCEEHLQPHQVNIKLQSHLLTEPVKDHNWRYCPAHHSPLSAFCCPDQQCICQDCCQEHSGHTIVSLDAARRDKEAELQCTQLDLERKLKLNENAISRLQANQKSVLVSVSEVKAVAEMQFGELLAAVRKAQANVMLFLEEKEQAALSQANGIKAHLEYRSAEMEKSKQELERMAAISNTVQFLEEYCKFKNTEDITFPSVYIGLKDKLSGIRKVITESTVHLIQLLENYKKKLQEFSKEEEYDIRTQVSAVVQRKYWTSKPEPSTREQFLQYAYDITFDPDTAHKYLQLQEENRKVTNTTPWEHPYPDLPSRFLHWRQVLSQQSLYLHRVLLHFRRPSLGTGFCLVSLSDLLPGFPPSLQPLPPFQGPPLQPQMKDGRKGLNQDITDVCFSPEKDHSSKSATSQVYWTAKTQHTSLPLSKAPENEHLLGAASNPEEPWRNSLRCISEMNRLFSGKGDITKPGYDPCNLLVDLDDIRDLSSGFSKYRDFIRYLPIHLAKYILRMLDRHTLNKCASVSQHWAAMAQQVKMDLSAHGFTQNQITFLQGSYTRGIDPNYANKVSIPVPKMVDDGKSMRVKHPKWKLRTKNEYNLWTAYQNEETQQVLMEERNVFCGTYNVRILSDTWDQNRVIHYSGGDLIAVSSNRKIHLLDIIQVKAIPVEFRGAGSVRALFLCEEENFLLSGSYDLSIRYWDLKSGVCARIFGGHQGTITCMDLCKNRLVSGGRDCQVKVWDVDTGKCLKTFRHKDPILATRINDTYIVSSCERGLVKVWHIAMAQLVKTLNGHEGAVKCLFFDQWHLLSGSTDGLVMAWSMVGKYERCLMAFKHPKLELNNQSKCLAHSQGSTALPCTSARSP